MQTEIRFLLDLVLNYKLPAEAKKLCLERIGEVEASLALPQRPLIPLIRNPIEQAPSTQRLMDMQGTAPVTPMTAPVINPAQRIVGGEVNTGNGTRGPRKF